jgi:hypothetical protein
MVERDRTPFGSTALPNWALSGSSGAGSGTPRAVPAFGETDLTGLVEGLSRSRTERSPPAAVHQLVQALVVTRRRGGTGSAPGSPWPMAIAPIGVHSPRDPEPRAEIGHDPWLDAEERGTKPLINDSEQDEQRSETGIDIPVRNRPARFVAVRPAIIPSAYQPAATTGRGLGPVRWTRSR